MQNEHVIPSPSPPPSPKDPSNLMKKLLIIFVAIIFLAAIGAAAYFIGKQGQKSEEISVEITEAPTSIPTIEPTPTSTTSATLTPSPTGNLTPTQSPSPTPIVKQKTLSAIASLDGFRSSNGGGNASVDIRAGRNINLVTRGFVSFDLSNIPSGATIQEASLRLYQAEIKGSPYSVGGALKVDHLNYGDSLDNSDYAMAALLSSFVTLTSNNVVEWKDASVTDQVKDDIANGRSRSQFRLHFTTEVKGGTPEGDFAYFESADNYKGTGNTPQLVVKYY